MPLRQRADLPRVSDHLVEEATLSGAVLAHRVLLWARGL